MKRFLLSLTKIPWILLCVWVSHWYADHHPPDAWIASFLGGTLAVAGMMIITWALGEWSSK